MFQVTRECGCQHLPFADPMYVILESQNKEEPWRGFQSLDLSNMPPAPPPPSHTSSTKIISHSLLILNLLLYILKPQGGSHPTGLGQVNCLPWIPSTWPLHIGLSPLVSGRCSCLLIQRHCPVTPLVPQDTWLLPQIPSHGKKTRPSQPPRPVPFVRASCPGLPRAGLARGPTRPLSSVQVLQRASGLSELPRCARAACAFAISPARICARHPHAFWSVLPTIPD